MRKVEPSLMVKKDEMILEQYFYDKKTNRRKDRYNGTDWVMRWYRLHRYRPLFSKLFNSLFLFQRANKQLSILLGYDIAIQSLNYHLAFIGCMNHAVPAIIQTDVLTTLALPASSCGSKVRRLPQLPKSLQPNSAGKV